MSRIKYKSDAELAQLSGAELNDYTDLLSEEGLDSGPEWDRIYNFRENN